jgi:hypothetical protein
LERATRKPKDTEPSEFHAFGRRGFPGTSNILGAVFRPFLSGSLQPFIASGYIFGSGFGDTVVL